jgi:hypothetical protein
MNLKDAIHDVEKSALCRDREAIVQLVSLNRMLRDALQTILKSKYRDGCPSAEGTSNAEYKLEEELKLLFEVEINSIGEDLF